MSTNNFTTNLGQNFQTGSGRVKFFKMEVAPVTSQPSGQFGMIQKNPDNLPGLEALSYMRELTVKQRRPGCLERKPHLIR